MKKMLSLFAGLSLVATSSSVVVACSSPETLTVKSYSVELILGESVDIVVSLPENHEGEETITANVPKYGPLVIEEKEVQTVEGKATFTVTNSEIAEVNETGEISFSLKDFQQVRVKVTIIEKKENKTANTVLSINL